MTANALVGSALTGAGALFLLFGLRLTPYLGLLDATTLAVLALNGAAGASLVTAGAARLVTWTRLRLSLLWVALFGLVFATAGFRPAFLLLGGLLRGAGLLGRAGAWDGRLVLLSMLLLAAVAVLLVRWHQRAPAAVVPRALLAALSYSTFAVLGLAGWFLAPVLTAEALGFSGDRLAPVGFMALVTSPVGLVLGIVGALWSNAPDSGRSRLRRHGVAGLLVVAAPVILTAALLLA